MDRLNKKNKRIYWVEKISLTDILFFLIRSKFSDIKVNFDQRQARPRSSKFLGILGRTGSGGVFFPVDLTLHKLDAKGLALTYRVDKELNACVGGFIDGKIPRETGRFKDMLKSYLAENLKSKVIFITMAGSEIVPGKGAAGEAHIICLSGHPLNYLLCRFYSGPDFIVRNAIDPVGDLKYYSKPFYYLVFFLLCKLGAPKVKTNISDIRPAIWAEYYPSHFHDFWMGTIKTDDFDVVAYIDRSDTPVIKETTDEIEKKGIKWIDAQLPALIKMSRLGPAGYLKMTGRAFFSFFSNPIWLGIFGFEYYFLSSIYESVFRRYKVKIFLQHQEASWRQEAQANAAERAGGIMAGYHWSIYTTYLLPSHFFPQHVYFVWGKYMSEWLRKKNSACRYVLPSGMWAASNSRDLRRKDIFPGAADFIISVFDDSVGYMLHQSPGSLSEFYLRVLSVVEKHPGIACIVKSKQPLERLLLSIPSGKNIIDKMETLKGRGKLAVLDHSLFPLVASSCSDLCVGYSINSACTIAAVVGNCAAINWDCAGLGKHPFYRHPENKIVFRTLDEIEEAVLMASKGDKTIGDYSHWKKHINYFEDISAVNRIVGFMETYMKENMNTGDPEHSLSYAANKYLNDNKIGEDFFRKDDIWEDE